jgi:hypothetical protein
MWTDTPTVVMDRQIPSRRFDTRLHGQGQQERIVGQIACFLLCLFVISFFASSYMAEALCFLNALQSVSVRKQRRVRTMKRVSRENADKVLMVFLTRDGAM